MQSLKIVTTTLDMKQGQLGAGLHHLGSAVESGFSEVFIMSPFLLQTGRKLYFELLTVTK